MQERRTLKNETMKEAEKLQTRLLTLDVQRDRAPACGWLCAALSLSGVGS